MTPQQFIAKWRQTQLTERSACQQHFLDLCQLVGHKPPAELDPLGEWFTFERGLTTSEDQRGWADVWKRGHFAWEYKGKHKDLRAAYRQLQLYREALENPPLLVVCDMDRFEVHTNFTGTAKAVHAFNLEGLAEPAALDVLRKVFWDPKALEPTETPEHITEEAARRFGQVAEGLRGRGVPAPEAAHFLMKLMFCMFAEDIGLLPRDLFSRLLTGAKSEPVRLASRLRSLFDAMAQGGDFGADEILWFNGGLFKAGEPVHELTSDEIGELIQANVPDWADVEPSIFGTLFERLLDPSKRSQIGAHYTSRKDIETLLQPVMMVPLRREWDAVRAECDALWPKIQEAARQDAKRRKDSKPRRQFDRHIHDFVERLSQVTVLDPACGSGNFLYVALHLLLDLQKDVIAYAASHGVTQLPQVRPTQLAGIEINPYAHELASVVIWIGYLQWVHHNAFNPPRNPVLEPIDTIRRMDAILDLSDPDHPQEPEWPAAEFIVGNPPFLGGKLLRANLGDEYVNVLYSVWRRRVRSESDLCCYWFEKAREQVERGKARRAGLLATQGIRGGSNRETLKRIKSSGDIFFAESDRKWVLDGAAVHVSMVGFDSGTESERVLDGIAVTQIHANLTSIADVTAARRLQYLAGIGFMGDTKGGPFDITLKSASEFLSSPNVHGQPNSDVFVPWANGLDITRRSRDVWILDFPLGCSLEQASLYDAAFSHALRHVCPQRAVARTTVREWWLHERPRPDMRSSLAPLPRFLATATVSKHRLFVWLAAPTLADHQLIVFANAADEFLGFLHSRVHETWARSQGTQVRERESGFRYTPTTCFETFPFPEPTEAQRAAIGGAAAELDRLRNGWLNPPEWTREEVLEFPGSVDGPWRRYVHDADSRGIGTVRYPRLVARDEAAAKKLKVRTLTNLYNERPTWLDLIHRRLDEAVFAAYGWPADLTDDQILERLLELNLSRAAASR